MMKTEKNIAISLICHVIALVVVTGIRNKKKVEMEFLLEADMITTDETKEARIVLNKLDKMIIDIEFGDTDEVMEEGIDTLKMVKTSFMHFVSELAKAERKMNF